MDKNSIVIVAACALAVIGIAVVKRMMLKSSRSPARRALMLAALAAGIMAVMSILLSLLQ